MNIFKLIAVASLCICGLLTQFATISSATSYVWTVPGGHLTPSVNRTGLSSVVGEAQGGIVRLEWASGPQQEIVVSGVRSLLSEAQRSSAGDGETMYVQAFAVDASNDLFFLEDFFLDDNIMDPFGSLKKVAIGDDDRTIETVIDPEQPVRLTGSNQRLHMLVLTMAIDSSNRLFVLGYGVADLDADLDLDVDANRPQCCLWELLFDSGTNEWCIRHIAGGGVKRPDSYVHPVFGDDANIEGFDCLRAIDSDELILFASGLNLENAQAAVGSRIVRVGLGSDQPELRLGVDPPMEDGSYDDIIDDGAAGFFAAVWLSDGRSTVVRWRSKEATLHEHDENILVSKSLDLKRYRETRRNPGMSHREGEQWPPAPAREGRPTFGPENESPRYDAPRDVNPILFTEAHFSRGRLIRALGGILVCEERCGLRFIGPEKNDHLLAALVNKAVESEGALVPAGRTISITDGVILRLLQDVSYEGIGSNDGVVFVEHVLRFREGNAEIFGSLETLPETVLRRIQELIHDESLTKAAGWRARLALYTLKHRLRDFNGAYARASSIMKR